MSGHAIAVLEAQPSLSLEECAARMAPHAARIDELLRRYPVKRGALLQILWLIQEEFGWVPRIAIKWAAKICQVSPVHAFSVVEFYTMYRQVPMGRYIIRVCHNVSCHLQGAEALIAHLEKKLSIRAGGTTPDGLFSLERVECLAACSNGPAVQVNDEFLYGPEGLNQHQEAWHPSAEHLDAFIERVRREHDGSSPGRIDELGGIMLGTAGHPGASGATADPLDANAWPPPPALKLAANGHGNPVTVSWLAAPECCDTVLQRSDDGGSTWRDIGNVVPASVPGPPGPKQCQVDDAVEPGRRVSYRVNAVRGDGRERLSAVIEFTGQAAPEGEPGEGADNA